MFIVEMAMAAAAAFKIAGSIYGEVNALNANTIQQENLRRQAAIAKAQGEEQAIKQDRQIRKVLSANQVAAVAQGTTEASVSGITFADIKEFSDDREQLNTNMRLNEDIYKANKEELKNARTQSIVSTALNVGSTIANTISGQNNPIASDIKTGGNIPDSVGSKFKSIFGNL